jgi:hypothetical protein
MSTDRFWVRWYLRKKFDAHGDLPSRFPIGTKFVIEGKYSGRSQVYRRHLEFPDGRVLWLPGAARPSRPQRRLRPA